MDPSCKELQAGFELGCKEGKYSVADGLNQKVVGVVLYQLQLLYFAVSSEKLLQPGEACAPARYTVRATSQGEERVSIIFCLLIVPAGEFIAIFLNIIRVMVFCTYIITNLFALINNGEFASSTCVLNSTTQL